MIDSYCSYPINYPIAQSIIQLPPRKGAQYGSDVPSRYQKKYAVSNVRFSCLF